jgi:hypothetical protein
MYLFIDNSSLYGLSTKPITDAFEEIQRDGIDDILFEDEEFEGVSSYLSLVLQAKPGITKYCDEYVLKSMAYRMGHAEGKMLSSPLVAADMELAGLPKPSWLI